MYTLFGIFRSCFYSIFNSICLAIHVLYATGLDIHARHYKYIPISKSTSPGQFKNNLAIESVSWTKQRADCPAGISEPQIQIRGFADCYKTPLIPSVPVVKNPP